MRRLPAPGLSRRRPTQTSSWKSCWTRTSGRVASWNLPAPGLDATSAQPIFEQPGTIIGPYKLLEQIGEGGMGVVYMAEQQAPVQPQSRAEDHQAGHGYAGR